ncbi:lectin C-type domain protein [Ancylostoma duodenale]|uniref:Lectin C-type domain protein n=1 Tax=Ancylostoma duodenale TaxID=51022 RepID=A0A0C2D627_9BILA|nr:lectin C-type domain protein [Ancylostoma duodenale]
MKLLLLALLPLAATFTCPANTIYHQEFSRLANRELRMYGALLKKTDIYRCYKFSADALPFYMAEEACLNLGGHLISFAGGLENAMVAETAQQQNIGSSFFIGLNKLNGNAWGYTDGQNVSFTNWASGKTDFLLGSLVVATSRSSERSGRSSTSCAYSEWLYVRRYKGLAADNVLKVWIKESRRLHSPAQSRLQPMVYGSQHLAPARIPTSVLSPPLFPL